MSEEIIKILDDLGKRFGIVIDWSSQNVMPYLQDLMNRFIQYKTATAIVMIIVSILILIIGIIVTITLIKWKKSEKFNEKYISDDNFTLTMFSMFIAAPMIIIPIIVIFCNINGIIQNTFIPELTIIEYLKSFNI